MTNQAIEATLLEPANDPPIVPTATLLSETTPDGITRSLTVSAAYDFRAHPRNYGIHHTEFRWLVRYRNIGVELRASPRWYLPQNRQSQSDEGSPRLAELTIHSPEPLYEGQEPRAGCSITGGDCYCDGSFAAGTRLAEILIADPAGFWPAMEQELSETQTRMLPMTGRRSKIMSETLTTEQVEEILRGCEGVTPGPWEYLDIGEVWYMADDNYTPVAITDHGNPTGEHIARLDPQTVSSLATELLALRKMVGDERKRAVAAIHWVFNADGTVGERAMAQEAIHKINDPTFMPPLAAPVEPAADFDGWWSSDGQYLDPDTSEVPWFDKRRGLAEYAYAAGKTSALTAYEAAKGGGVDASFPTALSDSEVRIWINSCNHEPARQALRQLLAYRVRGVSSALTSPASGERDAVIEECAKVAEAEELTGDAPSHFTQHEIDIVTATVRSTARSIAAAIRSLRMEGK